MHNLKNVICSSPKCGWTGCETCRIMDTCPSCRAYADYITDKDVLCTACLWAGTETKLIDDKCPKCYNRVEYYLPDDV